MTARRIKGLEITLATFIAVILAAPATSDEPSQREPFASKEPISISIDAAGIDIASPSGAERVYREVVATATRICGASLKHYQGVRRDVHEREHVRPCVQRAVDDALAQVADATGLDLEQLAGLDGFDGESMADSR